MQLRSATPLDVPAIAALHAASWRSTYRGALSDEYLASDLVADRNALWSQRLLAPSPQQYVVVAQENDTLLGFACAYLNEDPGWGSLLDNIHVSPQAHRRGVGSKLLLATASHCAAVATEIGLYLWVLRSNTAAQAFYSAYGAKNVGADVWDAPGGTSVPRFRFAWRQAHLCTPLQ